MISKNLDELPPIKEYVPNYLPENKNLERKFSIEVKNGVYYVDAPWLENVLRGVNFEDYESLQYLHRVICNSGINAELEKMGICQGDSVNLQGFEFEFIH